MRTTHHPDTVVPAPALNLSPLAADRIPKPPPYPTMNQPPPSRSKERTLFILLACLSCVLLAWRISQEPRPESRGATRSLPEAAAPGSPADTVVPAMPTRLEAKEERNAPLQASAPARMADPALQEPGSPLNSSDPDKNREWARNFPSAAAAWLNTAPAGYQRVVIAETICPELMNVSPTAAVTLAETCLGDGTNDTAKNLLDNMAQQWAAKDPRAASAWALGKPEGETRDRLLQRIAFVTAQTDPREAARLVFEKMSPGSDQNEAALAVLHQWARRDLGAALTWAESFPSGDLRARALEEVVEVAAVFAPENQFSGAIPE